ncbi:hypothetical protein EJ04DRAFT_573144 [Polyplosphaeria fusca]|uniref:Uncharacterized protein n=1 Tax=Polyplosphaeria fusca TaxID=682080 RepID=A0A9P4R8M3_9PLEO|nr:hypothetical protein EJ04DRAFT_573144 [Polyplosphaeria fusca]
MPYLTSACHPIDAGTTAMHPDVQLKEWRGKGKERASFTSRVVGSTAALARSMTRPKSVQELSDYSLSLEASRRVKISGQPTSSQSRLQYDMPSPSQVKSCSASSCCSSTESRSEKDEEVEHFMMAQVALQQISTTFEPRYMDSQALNRLNLIAGHMDDFRELNEEDCQAPDFHCPWAQCHKRFINPTGLQMITSDYILYFCPHVDCVAHFRSQKEWIRHFLEPHHDLLEEPMRSPDHGND